MKADERLFLRDTECDGLIYDESKAFWRHTDKTHFYRIQHLCWNLLL
jgi:uncharacterized C2H2 Zn-finger protein